MARNIFVYKGGGGRFYKWHVWFLVTRFKWESHQGKSRKWVSCHFNASAVGGTFIFPKNSYAKIQQCQAAKICWIRWASNIIMLDFKSLKFALDWFHFSVIYCYCNDWWFLNITGMAILVGFGYGLPFLFFRVNKGEMKFWSDGTNM